VALLRELSRAPRRLGVRVLFIPGTIGSICWLARNPARIPHVKHGLSLVCLGDQSPLCYKRTLAGDAEVDQIVEAALQRSGQPHEIIDYFPYGYDERQFNSPGFALPFGSLMRGQHGKFPEYHTSGDNLDFVTPDSLERSLSVCLDIVSMLDDNRRFENLFPHGEPQLGKRGVYRALGGTDIGNTQLAIFWVLALSDGKRSLLDVSRRAGLDFGVIRDAAQILERQGLLAARQG
jgi:aminopeptidase-like protein